MDLLEIAQEFEKDYEVGVELCRKHNISALKYFKFLESSKDINKDVIKHRLKDVYYFLILDRDIRGN